MPFPVAVTVCEDHLRRDMTFLKAFADRTTDLRVLPLQGGALGGRAVRLVRREIEAIERSGLGVRAVVVHHDGDTSAARRRDEIRRWFHRSGLAAPSRLLVACVPVPCTERWLCLSLGVRLPRRAGPAAGCAPWKEAWQRGRGLDLDRVRTAAAAARSALAGHQDFDLFLRDWTAAGLS